MKGNEPVQGARSEEDRAGDQGGGEEDRRDDDRHVVDIQEHIDALDDGVERLEELRRDVLDQAAEEDEERGAISKSTSEEYESVERSYRKLQKSRDRVENLVDEYDGGEWVLRELKTGAVQHARDEARQQNPENDIAEGHLKLILLEKAIADSPPGAPDDVREYPQSVSSFLYDKVDAINTGGDTDLGLVPLEQAMEE